MKMWEFLNFREKFRSLKPQEGCAIHHSSLQLHAVRSHSQKEKNGVFVLVWLFFFTIMSHKNTELHNAFPHKIQVT